MHGAKRRREFERYYVSEPTTRGLRQQREDDASQRYQNHKQTSTHNKIIDRYEVQEQDTLKTQSTSFDINAEIESLRAEKAAEEREYQKRVEVQMSLFDVDEDEKEQALIEERRLRRASTCAKDPTSKLYARDCSVDDGGGDKLASKSSTSLLDALSEDGGFPQGREAQGTFSVKDGSVPASSFDGKEESGKLDLAEAKSHNACVSFDMFTDDFEHDTIAGFSDKNDKTVMMDRGDTLVDREGYYAHRIGDILNERFKVVGTLGKGVFSTVLRCLDMKADKSAPCEVAVKVQRNNDVMRRAGEKEIGFLSRLSEGDPEGKMHCIRLIDHFDQGDHLCIVFELMHQNLRQALKQHGHRRGVQIGAIRAYSRQLFHALRYMEKLGIVHADLKPDNVVVNAKYNTIKICDFGSACNVDECDITPYFVSRFYRAPEIIMGLRISCEIDMWAAACTLFELYTGRILFQGNTNNQMLKLMQNVKGKLPTKVIRKGIFSELHFSRDNDFIFKEKDRVSGREVERVLKLSARPSPGCDLKTLLIGGAHLPAEELKLVSLLANLLEQALALDPSKRLSASHALKHPFCSTD